MSAETMLPFTKLEAEEPVIVLKACELLGVKSEDTYVKGDRKNDILVVTFGSWGAMFTFSTRLLKGLESKSVVDKHFTLWWHRKCDNAFMLNSSSGTDDNGTA